MSLGRVLFSPECEALPLDAFKRNTAYFLFFFNIRVDLVCEREKKVGKRKCQDTVKGL